MAARLIALQFMLSSKLTSKNPELLSPITIMAPEQAQERASRKERRNGTIIIHPTPNVGLDGLLEDLEAASYTLVGAKAQERDDDKGKRHTVVRFLFAARKHVKPSPEFDAIRADVSAKLACLACHAMWMALVWRNPFIENDTEVEGQYCFNINLKERNPLYDGVGPGKIRRTVWPKDANGNRIDTEKVPLMPDYDLRLDEDTVTLDDVA